MTAGRPTSFVARHQGIWELVPPVGAATPLELADLLVAIGIDRAATSDPNQGLAPARPHADAPADAVVDASWLWIGEIEPSVGLVVEDASGQDVVLDAADLAVLDLITAPRTVAWLREVTHLAEVPARVARLAAAGTITIELPVAPPPDPPARRRWRRPVPAPPRTDGAVEVAAAPSFPDPKPPSGGPEPGGPAGRIPVYAVWHPHVGPLLALGMLTAALRHHRGGALNATYEIRRPETAASFLADLRSRSGPAVLLCSDYVWSLEDNLEAARAGRAMNPDLVVVHGGPSSPKYEADAERFLEDHAEVAHVLTRGEGEHLVCELLEALAPDLPELDAARLALVDGITFRDRRSGTIVRTPERARIADLDALPSPYLTGEFDHIGADDWAICLSVETNRGCPYSCTFCDWGSSTMSRVRKFSLDRVVAEVRWAAERGVSSLNLPDANFGIMSRDVETARHIAEIKQQTGHPSVLSFYPAKNTTKHLARIMDIVIAAGIGTTASISLQTSDPDTLEAIARSNISTDHYVALAADYRRRGLPLQGDLLLGLPGQTYQSYRRDLQFNLDHEILSRTWQVHILPNSPMNDPQYKAEHRIESDALHRVVATSSYTPDERERMIRLRRVEIVTERMGLLRHVMRWLQWDHGILATQLMDHLLDVGDRAPDRFPVLSWTLRRFEDHPTAPRGWSAFYAEVAALLREDFDVAPSTDLATVLALNRFLMPAPGRAFPASIRLAHDYAEYYREATDPLFTTGHAGRPPRPLREYGPATFTIAGDPLELGTRGLRFHRWGTGEMEGDFSVGANCANELDSPLVRILPHVATIEFVNRDPRITGIPPESPAGRAGPDQPEPPDDQSSEAGAPQPFVPRPERVAIPTRRAPA